MEKGGWVYIMANLYRGGMFVGVTSDLIRCVWQHREGEGSTHVADFAISLLVYAERQEEIEPLRVKSWSRSGAANGICAD